MKLYKISLALLMGIGTLTSCSDKLELSNPNQPTTETFGNSTGELEEAVIAMLPPHSYGGNLCPCRLYEMMMHVAVMKYGTVPQSYGHFGADDLNASYCRQWWLPVDLARLVLRH